MTKQVNPLDLWSNGMEFARIALEANSIIAMRFLGMMGIWKMRDTEMVKMFAEKPPAFAEAWLAGVNAAMTGAGPEKIMAASMRPIGRATHSNHRRLSRSGLRF